MSTVRVIPSANNLIDAVIASLSVPERSIVVFPGKRPAHVLRKKLAAAAGKAFLPPKIFSVDLFVDYLYRETLRRSESPIGEFDAAAILFELHSALPPAARIGGDHYTSLEAFFPVGKKIFAEMEELMIASVTAERLAAAVSSVTVQSTHALATLYGPFYESLRSRGFTSRAVQYRATAEAAPSIDLSAFDAVILAGFYALTPTEVQLFRNLSERKNVTMILHEGEGIDATLDALGVRGETEGPAEERTTEQIFYESPDPHGQMFALNRVLAERYPVAPTESDEAAIILPSSENLFPLYHQTLAVFPSDTYNLALGYPVSRTPAYGFLLSLTDVIVSGRGTEVFVPKYLQFLLHPYTKNILFGTRTDVTRMAVHAIEDYCVKNGGRVFTGLESIERDPHLFEQAAQRLTGEGEEVSPEEIRTHVEMIHSSTIRPLRDVRTIGEFAGACLNVLQFINDRSTADRHPYFRPFVGALAEQLIALRDSLLAPYSFDKPEYYSLLLRHAAESAEVPFAGTPLQGLQVLGFLETRGLQFDTVFVLDANDDVLPGKAQQDVLLPLSVREQLGLPTYRDQEKIKSYLFDNLRKGARSVHYFYVNNHEKEQSRFTARLQWEEQLRNSSLRRDKTFVQEYRVDLSTGFPGAIGKSAAAVTAVNGMNFSSTSLDTYLTCGLRFYYSSVLGFREKEEISGDVERSGIGTIVHRILQEYFAPMKDRPLVVADLDIERLHRVVEDQFRSWYGSTQFGEQFFAKRSVERHLAVFLEQIQRPAVAAGPVLIESLEEELRAEIDGITFTGKTDRIETRGSTTYIIDFKTGHNEKNYRIDFRELDPDRRETWKETIGSLQLPLYLMLYAETRRVDQASVVPAFVFLGKNDLSENCEVPLFDTPEQQQEWYPKLRSIIRGLVREIRDPQTPFQPTPSPKTDCPGCPFTTICGTQWVQQQGY